MTKIARIALVHTNDLHSQLDNWPHTAYAVRAELERAEAAGRPAAYVDAGDCLDMSERTCYGTVGEANLGMLSLLDCKAFTIGNNEVIRMRPDNLSDLAARSPFPWLGANLRRADGSPLEGLHDWTIIEVGAVKVGVFGLTPPYETIVAAMGLTHPDTDETIRRCVAELRAAGADVVVFLSHLGIGPDREIAAAPYQGIDLIIGGHDHVVLAQPEIGASGVVVAQAGMFGEHVGVLELDVDLEQRRLAAYTGRLVKVDPATTPADEEAEAFVRMARRDAEAALREVVTELAEPLPHEPTGESKLGPLIAEALRRKAGAEVGLIVGTQAMQGFEAGPVTRAMIMSTMPSLFVPAVLECSGATLADLLAQSEDPAIYTAPSRAGGQRPHGVPIGRIFTVGIERAADGAMLINGEALDPQRVYRVGGPSLMGFAEAGYPAFGDITIVKRFVPDLVREVFEELLPDLTRI